MGSDAEVAWSKIGSARIHAGYQIVTKAPANAFTLADYAERYKVHYETARYQVRRLALAGILSQGRRVQVVSDGRTRTVNVYWPK